MATARPDHFSIINIILCQWQKNRKTWSGHARLCASIAMEESLIVCELARAFVNFSRSMKIATFSTQDLQEQCHKSYIASYQANEELVISRMFSRKLCQ